MDQCTGKSSDVDWHWNLMSGKGSNFKSVEKWYIIPQMVLGQLLIHLVRGILKLDPNICAYGIFCI